ncbi:glycosyltransferase 87 family protein [Actinomyces sp. HMT897]|uniref:glycosyltransferase 87 family protein n=1 Tax=Actinomyces sp. HMT897 TaxID=2789424 RepID=UPI001909787A|nr:glycosyltransferase 87 family protein [Actinomyces sp. HMT897]QQO77145.1 DUF2029 domain-containing protein [Actinomyces sp. HMT897]
MPGTPSRRPRATRPDPTASDPAAAPAEGAAPAPAPGAAAAAPAAGPALAPISAPALTPPSAPALSPAAAPASGLIRLLATTLGWVGLLASAYRWAWNTDGSPRFMLDAWIYRHAVEQWHAGGSLYDWYANPADHLWPFTYPPFAAWALTPLTTVTQDHAFQVVMLLATPVCMAVTAWACLRALGVRRWAGAAAPWLGLIGVLTLEPVYKTMEYAQVNAVLAALVAVDLLAVPASSRWRGVLCGLAAAFKLTPAIAVVVLLVRRQWRAAATMVATASGVTLACWALSPRESARFFLQAAWDPTRAGFAEYAGNQNLKGMVARALVGDERLWTPLWAVSVVAVTVLAVLLAVRTDALRPSRQTGLVPGGAAPVPGTPAPGSAAPAPGDPCARTGREHHPAPGGPRLPDAEGTVLLLQLGVVMGLGLLVSPISWSHHWVWCLPMVMGLTAAAWRWRSGVLGLCAATGWAVFALAMQWWFPNQNHLEAGWTALQRWAGSSYTLWALVTGAALAWEVRRRAATDRGARPVPTRPDRGEADPVPPREPLCGRPQDTP